MFTFLIETIFLHHWVINAKNAPDRFSELCLPSCGFNIFRLRKQNFGSIFYAATNIFWERKISVDKCSDFSYHDTSMEIETADHVKEIFFWAINKFQMIQFWREALNSVSFWQLSFGCESTKPFFVNENLETWVMESYHQRSDKIVGNVWISNLIRMFRNQSIKCMKINLSLTIAKNQLNES